MATVELFQERTNEGPSGFKIYNQVVSAVDIPTELFVFRFSDNTFSHVVTLGDFYYPPAPTAGFSFYRLSEATVYYDNIRQALDFACHVKYRIDNLVKNYDDEFNTFDGNDTTNYPLP